MVYDKKRNFRRRRLRLCNLQTLQDFMPIIPLIRDEKGRFLSGGIKPMQGRKHKESTRKILSIGKIGSKNPVYGTHLSISTKKLISEKSKQRWQDPIQREIMLESARLNGYKNTGRFKKGMIISEEQRQRSSERMKSTPKHWKASYEDTKPERMLQIALALNGIKFEKQKMFKLGNRWHKVDIFIKPNICVEVDGVYWHIPVEKIKRDLLQSQILTIMGYHIIRIRDKDILKNANNASINVINLIKQVTEIPNLRKLI